MALDTSCNNTQKVPVTVTPTSASGAPAPIDGALRLSVLSGDGTIAQDPADPLRFFVVSGNSAGVSTFLVEADARQGAEEFIISDQVNLTVTQDEPTSFGFVAGAPEPK